MYIILGIGISNICVIENFKKMNKDFILVVEQHELVKASRYSDNILTFEKLKYLNFSKVKYAIKSPGIPYYNKYIKFLKNNNVKVINEIELTYLLTNKKGKYIGVSGSVGKSSVVSLLYELVKIKYDNVILAGNIGIPLISKMDKINKDTIIILELSSFQLDDFISLKLDIALLLNIFDNHLDVYRHKQDYYLSKFKLTNNQSMNDYFIVNLDNDLIKKYTLNHIFKSQLIDYKTGFDIRKNYLYYYNKKILDLGCYLLKGEHNLDNLKAIVVIMKILNFKIDNNVLSNFYTLDYHLQEKEYDDILVVNDSKSTCLSSLESAINTYKDRNIILLFGGYNKNLNFKVLSNYKFKYLICFGKLCDEIDNMVKVDIKFSNLHEGVKFAYKVASKSDVILFSPGCASFDEFNSYKERGKKFNDYIEGCFNE